MLELLIDSINVKTLTMASAAIAAIATVLTFAMPLMFAKKNHAGYQRQSAQHHQWAVFNNDVPSGKDFLEAHEP